MIISRTLFQKSGRPALFCLIFMIVFTGTTLPGLAKKSGQKDIENLLRECLIDLWTGQTNSPIFHQRQQAFKTILESTSPGEGDLAGMVKSCLVPIVEHHQTSRYCLNALPEKINTLFSPVLDWKAFEKILWWALSSTINENDPVLITIGTLGPPGTPWLNVPETMLFPKIKKISLGKVRLKIYGGGVMGEDTEILDKMADGRLDGCGCTALGVLEASPEASSMLVPGLFNSYDEVDYICEKFRKKLDRAFERNGYVLAGLIDTGYFYLFSKNKINSLADLQKNKVLTWFGTIEKALLQQLGINPIPVAVPDVVSAFGAGTGDVVLAPAAWMLGMQAYQYANFYYRPPLLYSPTAIFVTRQTVKRIQKQVGMSKILASNIQEAIIFEIIALEPEWNRQIRSYETKSLKAFETKCGIQALDLSPEDQKQIESAGRRIQQNLAGKAFSKTLIVEIQQALDEYRSRQ